MKKHLIGQGNNGDCLGTKAEETRSEEAVDALRMQLKASQVQISELDAKIQMLTSQLEANEREIKSLTVTKTTNEREETLTIISSSVDAAFESIQASEMHQEHDDSISDDFDQQDRIHSAIEKFEVGHLVLFYFIPCLDD